LLTRHPGRFTPGKDPVPIVQEAVWAPGPVWTSAEKFGHTGIFLKMIHLLDLHDQRTACLSNITKPAISAIMA